MNKMHFADLHQDIINLFKDVSIADINKIGMDDENNDYQINIPFMKKANTKMIFSTSFAFFKSKQTLGLSHFENILYTLSLNAAILSLYKDTFSAILTPYDIEKLLSTDKIGMVNHLEGLYGITDMRQIDVLYNLGIRSMGITWNYDSDISTCCKTKNDFGLTYKGKEIIKYVLKKNIIIDLSHISDKAFEDVISICDKPVIVSHTAIRSLNDCDRNITDHQLDLIKKNGGLVGINFSTLFLNGSFEGKIDDVVKHIRYAIDKVGIDHVGIGSDFEGIGKNISPEGLKTIADTPKLGEALLATGFSPADVEKIMYKNALNFVKAYL